MTLSIVVALMSLPSLVAGYLRRVDLKAVNLDSMIIAEDDSS